MYRERSLLKRCVFPEDIAEAVAFFASDRSAKSTGNIINVDAGNAGSFHPLERATSCHEHRKGRRCDHVSATPASSAARIATRAAALDADYAALAAQLQRRGIDIERSRAGSRSLASRSRPGAWARAAPALRAFPGIGEPRNVFEKLDDCAVIHAAYRSDADACRCTSRGTRRRHRRPARRMAMRWASALTP